MRVLIFGNSGSGKSTLARQLAAQHGLTHLDLDVLAWEPDHDVPTLRPPEAVAVELDAFVREHEGWVVEGCYADLLALLGSSATDAVFLNLDVEQCLQNAGSRPWEPHKYETRAEQDANLPMLLGWITDYYTRTDQFSHARHVELFRSLPCRSIELRENPSISTYDGLS